MASIIHADIFFFIASIFVAVMTAVFLVSGFYLVGALRNFRDISSTLKRGMENAEENLEETMHNIEESPIFRFFFGRKRRYRMRQSLKK